jgi:hypothetical protein
MAQAREKHKRPPPEPSERVGVLSEMAQIQRRNAEFAMNLYTWVDGGSKKDPGKPMFPEEVRKKVLERINGAIGNLMKIDDEVLKLL